MAVATAGRRPQDRSVRAGRRHVDDRCSRATAWPGARVGTFTIAGRSHDVTRTYQLADGWVFFDDGRPFHPWRPGEWVEHLCGEDTYRGLVEVEPARIRTLWDVSGPEKDQRLITRLTSVWQSKDT